MGGPAAGSGRSGVAPVIRPQANEPGDAEACEEEHSRLRFRHRDERRRCKDHAVARGGSARGAGNEEFVKPVRDVPEINRQSWIRNRSSNRPLDRDAPECHVPPGGDGGYEACARLAAGERTGVRRTRELERVTVVERTARAREARERIPQHLDGA